MTPQFYDENKCTADRALVIETRINTGQGIDQ